MNAKKIHLINTEYVIKSHCPAIYPAEAKYPASEGYLAGHLAEQSKPSAPHFIDIYDPPRWSAPLRIFSKPKSFGEIEW